MNNYNNNGHNQANTNSLQFYTMNKLRQEGNEIEFSNNDYGLAASNSLIGNQYSSNNVPRKSPFDIYNNDMGNVGNNTSKRPIMSSAQVHANNILNDNSVPMESEKMQVPAHSIFQPTTLNNANISTFNGVISIFRMLNPKSIWSNYEHSNVSAQSPSEDYYDDILNEPPLLEELGIDPVNIMRYMKCIVLFRSIGEGKEVEWDMAGPILLIGCLGFFLLLAGKIHFGYIYGIGILSCIGTYILLNIMSNNQGIELYTTMSILGYSLLPIVILAGISVVFSLRTKIGIIMAIFFNMWSTITASRFFEYTVSLKHQRYLIAYPIALLYACFTIVTIF